MPIKKIRYVLQNRDRAVQNLEQDPKSIGAVVSLGSTMPVERERRIRARLVDHDVVPLNDSVLRKAMIVPSVLQRANATTLDGATRLYDIVISIDGAFDMKMLSEIRNEALVTLCEYKDLIAQQK